MIELKQVTKQYGQATVLKNITLSIEEPGIYCLLGRNGAGKTTLLKSIAGYQNITSGSIQVDGKAITTSTLGHGRQLHRELCQALQPARAEAAADRLGGQPQLRLRLCGGDDGPL